jgi:ribosome-binding protein aMBF1 (putative translation factor)
VNVVISPSLWVEYDRGDTLKGRCWQGTPLLTVRAMDLLTRFAGNVRRLRSKKSLSQKALADKVGISVSYVSMLERGQRSPPLETIEKMAKALGVPPANLLGGR